ncbi:MAG: hypothetical protein QXT14_08905 [Candidatus Bathyarchaeia archaeon]
MEFLLGVLSPRDLDYFWNSLNKVDYVDIVIARNMEIAKALETLRNYALEHGYDYMIVVSDDTIIPYDAPAKLMLDCKLYEYKVITGYSKIRPNVEDCNITLEPPANIDKKLNQTVWYHEYKFVKYRDIEKMLLEGKTIVKVWFVGWSLTAIHREVLEKIKFRGWVTKKDKYGVWNQSCDLAFSYDIAKMGYEAYCDLTVYVPHIPTGRVNLNLGRYPEELVIKNKKRDITSF